MTNEEAFENFILSDDWQEIRLHAQNSDELAEKVWQSAIEFSNSEASKMRQPLKRLSEDKINEIWSKREHSTSIEKLAKEHCHHQQSADQFSITLYGLKQFAEAYAAKVLEDKEREIAELEIQNVLYKDDELEQQIAISELQAKNSELSASINDLREALEDIAKHTPENFWQNKAAQQVLSKTPAQSLQEFENETIERVMGLMEDMNANGKYHLPDYIEAIRALKVTND